jgi:hypothetical protein
MKIDFSPSTIANLLISFHWDGMKRLDEILLDVFYKNFFDDDLDNACEKYCDQNTVYFRRLIKQIIKINENNSFQKIELFEELDGFYVIKSNKEESISLKYDQVIKVIKKIEKAKNKGKTYEHFCKLFLYDLGINSIVTRASNDKGIDILGSYKVDFPLNITKLIFNEDIYLLTQTKYYNKPIDTPVIRKLVGDSLFIRFDELDYVNIRHNAFHLLVFSHNGFTEPAREFAIKNKIMIFDSTQIAHIISDDPNKDWQCLKIFEEMVFI